VAVDAVGQAGSIRIAGSYQSAACGPAGIIAELAGSTVRVTVGSRPPDPDCDLVRVTYSYEALLIGFTPGRYAVVINHRSNNDGPGQAVLSKSVLVY